MSKIYLFIASLITVLVARAYHNNPDILSDAMIAQAEQERELNNLLKNIIKSNEYRYWYTIFSVLNENGYSSSETICNLMKARFLDQAMQNGLISKDNPYGGDYGYVKKQLCNSDDPSSFGIYLRRLQDRAQLYALAHCMSKSNQKMSYGEIICLMGLIEQINNNNF